jgi:uncharacterized RDD family membrane protein YckC
VGEERVELPDGWTADQYDGLRYLLEQTEVAARWDGPTTLQVARGDREQVDGLISYLAEAPGHHAATDPGQTGGDSDPRSDPFPDDPRTVLVAGFGLRLAGWLVDSLVFWIAAVALRIAMAPSAAFWGGQLFYAAYCVLLVGLAGKTLGNRAVGTQVVAADDAARPGLRRGVIRWGVVFVPAFVAFLVTGFWLLVPWELAVYSPVLFTRLHQGVHDLVADVIVLNDRLPPERWAVAHTFFGPTRSRGGG